MTRKSKREIESVLDDLDAPDREFDAARERVTASFVTYDESSDDADIPDGWTVSETIDDGGATYRVVELEEGGQ
jgi:hypothetical protein